jgi:hypothetical protein
MAAMHVGFTFLIGRMTEALAPDIYRVHWKWPITIGCGQNMQCNLENLVWQYVGPIQVLVGHNHTQIINRIQKKKAGQYITRMGEKLLKLSWKNGWP